MEWWSLSTIDQSPEASFALLDSGTHPYIYPLPGCFIVPTSAGIYILDPITLTLLPCKMLQAGDKDSHSEGDDGTSIPRPQFDVGNCTLTILSMFNINWSTNKDKQNSPGSPMSSANVNAVNSQSNSSCVAMAINYRLIVMKITRR